MANLVNSGTLIRKFTPQDTTKVIDNALALFQRNRFAEADRLLKELSIHFPHSPDVLHFRGIIACRMGDFRQGVKLLLKAVEADPNRADFHVNLANAFRETKQRDKAIRHLQNALRLSPDIPEAHNSLGVLYNEQGSSDQAEQEFTEAIRWRPAFPEAHFNLALVHLANKNQFAAIESLLAALRASPNYIDALLALARVYKDIEVSEKAYPLYQSILMKRPDDWAVMMELATVLQQMGHVDESLEVARKAFGLAPKNDANVHIALANTLKIAGLHEEAISHYRKAMELNPDEIGLYNAIAYSKKYQRDDPEIDTILLALRRPGLSNKTKLNLHFALGKAYSDCRRYDDAFEHYLAGNRIRRKEVHYDPLSIDDSFRRQMVLFNKDVFEPPNFPGSDSDLPIFIVGMPRSGTSLTEQILSSHSQVFGAGELNDINHIKRHLTHIASDGNFPESLFSIEPDILLAVTHRLIENLSSLAPGARHVVDKMPHNFINLGLIAYLLPNARIIHCRRNPLDNCLSIFFQNFEAEHPYKWDLHDLGLYYVKYTQLMQHWRTVLPSRIFEVQYEELVDNQETVSRQLVDFCGLEWENACLEFHKSQRTVRTASQWQVRQPIYKTSTERWRRYEKHLAPLIEALGPLATAT